MRAQDDLLFNKLCTEIQSQDIHESQLSWIKV